ncbi:ELL-associated factor 1-like [Mya arenaria]|uniref:ELL-associated factor 1-like n=1 Tax=Mya arenaria TaxID=6604 RepID=UPI0022DF092A|nr:ELL-associated factor 1-like [Mya arenaria]
MAEKNLSLDSKPHELKFGSSFDSKQNGAQYHSIRYDFKPASVDTSREANLEIGEGHHVTLTVPNVDGSGIVYKGNKRPVQKECVLIIDHDTGTFTLERLSNNINVKKTRSETSSKVPQLVGRPITPVEVRLKSSPGKVKSSHSPSGPVKQPSPPASSPPPPKYNKEMSMIGEISSDSSSDDLSSDSDSDNETHTSEQPPVPMSVQQVPGPPLPPPIGNSNDGIMSIAADLQLSDSSDSDSD